MDARTITGVLGVLVIVAMVLIGMWGFVDTAALDILGDYGTATVASLGVVVAFVAVLSLVAIRADVLGRNPYW